MLSYQFMQNAIASCIMTSIVCALIGEIIVERRLMMMAGGIAHTAYGGVGLGYLCGFEPLLGALGFSVIAAGAIGFAKHRSSARSEVIIALFWSLGMALGVLFTSMMSGYPPDMTSYLFGSILAVTRSDLVMMAALTLVVMLSIIPFFNDWKTFLFDPEFAKVAGMRTGFMEYALLMLVAISCVTLIRAAGIILVIALLSAPAACAGLYFRTLKGRMAGAALFSLAFCLSGLWISFAFNIPSGATIVILSAICYGVLWSVDRVRELRSR